MVKKLDTYILSEFFIPFLSGAGIITGVWLGIDKFKEVFKLLSKSGAYFSTGFAILGLEIPQIMAASIPIAILFAAFLTFQKLSGQSEVIAMRSAGISFTRMMRPVALLGLIGAAAVFLLSEYLVPISSPLSKKIYNEALYKDPEARKTIKGFSYFEKDKDGQIKRIFYVKKIKDNILKHLVVLDFADKRLSQIHTADEGVWDPEKGGWVLYDGSSNFIKKDFETTDIDTHSPETKNIVSNFDETVISSNLNPKKIMDKLHKESHLNFMSLIEMINLHKDALVDTGNLEEFQTLFHNKFSYPASCILLALIGACLGISGRRRIINVGYIAIGLVVFIFYMSHTVFDSFGNSGKVEPLIAAWIPNLFLGWLALGIYLYRANK